MAIVTVNTRTRRAIIVPTSTPTITNTVVASQVRLDDLQDVSLQNLPSPYPGNLTFSQDQRYTLVYNPNTSQWEAQLEATVSAIDGGTY